MLSRVGACIFAFGACNAPAFYSPANAETAAELSHHCSADLTKANYGTGRCVGYVEAVVDELSEKQVMAKKKLFCPSSTVTNLDIIKAVRIFLDENRDQRNVPAHILVEYALRVKFPCR